MKKGATAFLYAACDFLASGLAWILFCIARDRFFLSASLVTSEQFLTGLILLPVAWVLAFMLTGFYSVSLKRSRLMELIYSITITGPVTFIIFFIFLATGFVTGYNVFLSLFLTLFFLQFLLTFIPRLIITTITARKVHKGLIGYRTLIIGSNGLAHEIFRKISEEKIPSGSIIIGYVSFNGLKSELFGDTLECFGALSDLPGILAENNIEEVIIAIEGNEHNMIGQIIGMLQYSDVTVKAIPSMKDILTGRVEHTSIFGTPLLEVSNQLMPAWQYTLKQLMDYLLASFILLILTPVIFILAILIRLSGPGPVIYRQERIGKNGKPFIIYKLRTMCIDAEKDEPRLSGTNDTRVTGIGKFMRRHRLDEIPNLVNVLRGEMSLVGPRPERQFFIDQIIQKAPHYRRLLKVKPGITSWGQVKYGYASSVDQMVERLEYDLLYIENMSLFLDLKIIIYTFIFILNGKGV